MAIKRQYNSINDLVSDLNNDIEDICDGHAEALLLHTNKTLRKNVSENVREDLAKPDYNSINKIDTNYVIESGYMPNTEVEAEIRTEMLGTGKDPLSNTFYELSISNQIAEIVSNYLDNLNQLHSEVNEILGEKIKYRLSEYQPIGIELTKEAIKIRREISNMIKDEIRRVSNTMKEENKLIRSQIINRLTRIGKSINIKDIRRLKKVYRLVVAYRASKESENILSLIENEGLQR